MSRLIIIVTHLKAKHPPDHERLRMALETLTKAVYGPSSTLHVEIGHTDENPDENMLHVLTGLNKSTQDDLAEALKKLFGAEFVIGCSGHEYFNATRAIHKATKDIAESFTELDRIAEAEVEATDETAVS